MEKEINKKLGIKEVNLVIWFFLGIVAGIFAAIILMENFPFFPSK